MKPIRLRKDNVVHLVHTGAQRVRIATGADVNRTAADASGFGWPTCWTCTDKRMQEMNQGKLLGVYGEAKFVPVEGYCIVDERENEEDLRAECSHGGPRVFFDTKILTMPRHWGKLKKAHKRSSLVFFADESGTPLGGNVVLA